MKETQDKNTVQNRNQNNIQTLQCTVAWKGQPVDAVAFEVSIPEMLQTIVGFACGTTLGMAESGMERVGIEDCLKVDFEYGQSQNKNKKY